MGQRLNIEIKDEGKVLANAYYHWSGYTSSALELIQLILESLKKVNFENNVIKAIKLLEETGAGLVNEELEYAKKIFKSKNISFSEGISRNEGLISITEEGIEKNRYWEESRVEIDLVNKTIKFDAVFKISIEEYEEEYVDEDVEDIPIYEIDFNSIQFNSFLMFKESILELINSEIYTIKIKGDDLIYIFIE